MARLKIYIDENVDIRVAQGLRKRGIDAFSVIEKYMSGKSDIEQFNYATSQHAVIFTHDHHFLKIAEEFNKRRIVHYGIIFAEMNRLSIGETIKRLSLYAELVSAEEMKNRIEFL